MTRKIRELRVYLENGSELWMPADEHGHLRDSFIDLLNEERTIRRVSIVDRSAGEYKPHLLPSVQQVKIFFNNGAPAISCSQDTVRFLDQTFIARVEPCSQTPVIEPPPLGVAPEHIRLEQRNVELGAAIERHTGKGFDHWCRELPRGLCDLIKEYVRNHERLKEIYEEDPNTKPSQSTSKGNTHEY